MGANRSHHYVPKCYLRNFAESTGQKTISLFNVRQRKVIKGAPIKSQCARDFLYGRDELEFHLSEIEGRYAEWITRGILARPPRLIEDIDVFCRFFAIIQYMRTEAHAARMRAHFSLTTTLADIPIDSQFLAGMDMSDTALARDGINFALQLRPHLDDLKFALLDNRSSENFLTCDDPVVMTNRLYFQRVGDSNFGLGSAGTIFYLPLSPKVAMVLYDGDVYAPRKRSPQWVTCSQVSDVRALNDLIFLKARENVYFGSPDDFSHDHFQQVESARIAHWERGKVLVQVDENEHGRIFRESDELLPDGASVIWTSQQHPRPLRWPKVLPFKTPAFGYSNGSGMGYMRRATVPPEAGGVMRRRV